MQHLTDREERRLLLQHEQRILTPLGVMRHLRRAWNRMCFIFSHTDPHDVRVTRMRPSDAVPVTAASYSAGPPPTTQM
ncbi:hypothetical protein [Streptomyces sp. NPDC002952]|uniref:hypothetical protein n=1 Tax=Streptomyces sp. NPDC002952 TaxID=3364673 RepID=UPI003681917D